MALKKILIISAICLLSACGNKEVAVKIYQEVKKQKLSEGWTVFPKRNADFNSFGNADAQYCNRREPKIKYDVIDCVVEFTNPQFPNKQLIVKYSACNNAPDCIPKVAAAGTFEFMEELLISSEEANNLFQKELAATGDGATSSNTQSVPTPSLSKQSLLPPSGKNETLDAKPENCSKVRDLMPQYKEAIATKYSVSMSSIRFIRNDGCMAIVDTATGPKTCGIGGVLWYKTGEYDAMNAIVSNGELKSGFGAVGCLESR